MANRSSFSVFKRVANDAHDGLILKPRIQNYFYQAKYPDEFTVTFKNAGAPRKPDGFFHPSTHPTQNVTQLFWYLKASHSDDPDRYIEHEQLSYESRMSVMMGTASHELIQVGTTHMGIMDKPSGICPACNKSQPDECNEQGVMDLETMTRGHMDDVLKEGPTGVDYKTSSAANLQGLEDHDMEAFYKKWPYYYGQGQNYMMATGLRKFIFLFVGLGHPWTMKEFVVPYDVEYCMRLERKYKLAISYYENDEIPPEPCCTKKNNRCPVVRCPGKS